MLEDICIHNLRVSIPDGVWAAMVSKTNSFVQSMLLPGQSVSYYQTRRNATKAAEDITMGKYGELIAYYGLRQLGFPKVLLDFEIRDGNKGWRCDLPFKGANSEFPNVHVKTCTAQTSAFIASACGDKYSWTFQYSKYDARFGRDVLFAGGYDNDLIAMVSLDGSPQHGCLVATAPWHRIHPILRDPICKKLVNLKKCIYFHDLLRSN